MAAPPPDVPRWKLEALAYPRAKDYSLANAQEVVHLVGFLENRHVRQLDIEERAPLEGAPGAAWNAAFAGYLSDAGCPLLVEGDLSSYDASRVGEYVNWLVGYAISCHFEDDAEAADLNAAADEALAESAAAIAAGEAQGDAAGGMGAIADVSVPPAAAEIIEQLAALCHVSTEGRTPFEVLQAVGRMLRQRILPAVAASEAAAVMEEEPTLEAAAAAAAAAAPARASGAGSGAMNGARISAALELAEKNPMSSLSAFVGEGASPLYAPGVRRAARARSGTHRAAAAAAAAVTAAGALGGGMEGAGAEAALAAAGGVLGKETSSFPLGFATGDAVLDGAAALLRMLWAADLRELQDGVNEILITVQSYTADPRTDASLGVVGR